LIKAVKSTMPDTLSQEQTDALVGAAEPSTEATQASAWPKKAEAKMSGILSQEEIDELFLIPQRAREALPKIKDAQKIVEQIKDAEGNIPHWQPRKVLDSLRLIPGVAELLDESPAQDDSLPRVTSYDFKHPARVNRDQLRTLENLHDNFARLLSSSLSGALRTVVEVDTAFVDQTTYAEFIMSLSNPSCSYQFTMGPTNGQAILDIAMPVVFGSIDRTLGGNGSSKGVEARQVTPIEIGVVNRIVKRFIDDLEATWGCILPVEISDIELEVNPEFMQITAPQEIVILLAFEVNSAHMSGLISLCYPFFTLESILPRLSQQGYVRQFRGSKEELVLENRLRLGAMDVPLVAELGRTRVPLSQVKNLQAGDIIRLPTRQTDPATVFLGGKPKFLARPFAESNGECKLLVAGRVPPQDQERYGTVS
jgi:flagellar motor switch protein FliM